MELSQGKLFTFNASSFALDPSVESFLRSKGAVSLDFGAAVYINSEAMPAVLSELIERIGKDSPSNADLVAQLKAEVGRYKAGRQKMIEDNARLVSEASSHSLEITMLKEQATSAAGVIETLKAENAHLQAALKNASAAPTSSVQSDVKLKQSYERLQKEFQALRTQSAEALTSLKVLEDENEELRQELEQLKKQAKNSVAPKTG